MARLRSGAGMVTSDRFIRGDDWHRHEAAMVELGMRAVTGAAQPIIRS